MCTLKLTNAIGLGVLFLGVTGGCRQSTPATDGPTHAASATQTQAPAEAPKTPPAVRGMAEFLEGKKQIEDSCYQCYKSNGQAFRDGIKKIERSIQMGYPERIEAYKVLARAYNDAMGMAESGKEFSAFESKRNQTIALLYEIDRADPEVLQAYADLLKDPEEKIRLLKEAIRIDPKRASAEFTLALRLIDKKEFAQGIDAVKLAVENAAEQEAAENYIVRTAYALKHNGCPVGNPTLWLEGMAEAYNGPVDTRESRMRDFNSMLSRKLAEVPCLKPPTSFP